MPPFTLRRTPPAVEVAPPAPQAPPSADQAGSEPETPAIQMPVGIRSVSLSILAGLAAVFALRYMQEVFIPIVLSVLIFYALDPFVDWLQRRGLPRALAAAVVLISTAGAVGAGAYALRSQAMAIVEELPRAAQQLRRSMQVTRREAPGAIEKVQQAATEIEKTAAAASKPAPAPTGVMRVQVEEPAFRASEYLWWGSMGVVGLTGDLVMISFLSYFLLLSDDLYKRKVVRLVPSFSKKKVTVQILDQIGDRIQRFLLVQVFTSLLVALATGLVLWWLGLEQAAVWGLLAGIFNSVPFFGPVIVSGALGIVAFTQFGTIPMVLAVAGAALVITTLEGWLLTPSLMGRAAQMSPAAIFIGLIFWSWIWGVWGLLLAVPILMAVKAICDHVDELQWVGELLGD
jgi:predicted PurR-regulated permease PerM